MNKEHGRSMKKTMVTMAAIAAALGLKAQWNGGGNEKPLEPQKRFERMDTSVEISAFLQDHRGGVYSVGEKVGLTLEYLGEVDRAEVKVIDFDGRTSSPVAGTVAPGRITFVIPGARRFGHYTCEAELFKGGRSLGYTQTAYTVLPEAEERRDPYFMIDKNCFMPDLMPQMKRVGFGSIFQLALDLGQVLQATPEQEEQLVARFAKATRSKLLAQKDFHVNLSVETQIWPSKFGKKLLEERVWKGLPLYTEEECLRIRRIAERVSREVADLHPLWLQQDEWDAVCYGELPWTKDYLTYIAGIALVSKNFSRGVKAGDPTAKYGIPGICCNDYMWAPVPFEHMSWVLAATHGDFDFVSLDAYSGGWRGGKRRFRPPEHIFRDMLTRATELSKTNGGGKEVGIAERCQSVPFAAAFDSYICRSEADMVARSFILSKAVPGNLVYSFHLMSYWRPAFEYETSTNRPAHWGDDLGAWKYVGAHANGSGDAKGYVPRPVVPAMAATIRELAFVSEPHDFAPHFHGRACVTFRREDGRTLAALWNIDEKPEEVEVVLPAEAELVDLMGNREKIAAGRAKFSISTSPKYLVAGGERKSFEQALRGAFPIPNEPKKDPRLKDSIPR